LAARAGFSRVRFASVSPGCGFDRLSHHGETGLLQSLAGRGVFLMKQLSDAI
jgi:hypothetical protein